MVFTPFWYKSYTILMLCVGDGLTASLRYEILDFWGNILTLVFLFAGVTMATNLPSLGGKEREAPISI